ncbi:MAG: class aldolase/adducin-like protein [Herbaspirillum sp.]|jgi:ribulose-5-phosphate 4-epimerase/fuculose-1-phosphate aldolase|nr:class aldolase/adducin-like protein [Herbaspirillum sp.]
MSNILTTGELTAHEQIALANRILYQQHVVDAFGHVSMRHPTRPDRFLLSRNMAPAQVTAADVLEFDLDSEPVAADSPPVYLERFIHGEIYRERPDVMSVVHSHSAAVIPFGIVKNTPLRPVCHMSGFLGRGAPLFEIRCCAGESSDMLIRNRDLGAALAKSLGDDAVVLMRGHGSTVTGATLYQAVFRAVYTEVNARLQSEALGLGEVNYLTEDEARNANIANDGQIQRAWNFWATLV